MDTSTHGSVNARSRLARRLAFLASGALALSALIAPVASAAAGAIWTTQETCADPAAQDANHYDVGDIVHIRGENFAANSAFSWTITRQLAGDSDPARSSRLATPPRTLSATSAWPPTRFSPAMTARTPWT
jgi:hypothetical protein